MSLSTFDTFKHMGDTKGVIRIEGENLRILQSILLQMLLDIDEVCTEEGIDYVLGGGNCLGAVRHQGFIPWDDDADIDMTRDGYEKFVPAFLERFGDKYWIHDIYRKEGYELCFPRIRLKGTVLKNRDDFDEDECGIYIDIFLLESVPNNALLRDLHGVGSLAIGFLWSCRRFYEHRDRYLELAANNEEVLRAYQKKIALGKVLAFLPLRAWGAAWDRWNSCLSNPHSEYLSCPVGRKHYFGELWKRSSLFPAQRVAYEGHLLCVPNKVEDWLKSLYGDYMTIPPVEDRETHVAYGLDFGDLVKLGTGED